MLAKTLALSVLRRLRPQAAPMAVVERKIDLAAPVAAIPDAAAVEQPIALDPRDAILSNGVIRNAKNESDLDTLSTRVHFLTKEKSEIALCAATSWYGGDYFEFGSVDLCTFQNMLNAFKIAALPERFPDTRFYAFDIFGKMDSTDANVAAHMRAFDERTGYFSGMFPDGDDLPRHLALLHDCGLFVDQCRLVQGFFQDTLNAQTIAQLKAENRRIGFAFIDCNFEEYYKVVFEFIFSLMAPHSYIYMDEYFSSAGALMYFDQLVALLRERRNIDCVFVRAAAGNGGLFRFYPRLEMPPLGVL